MNKSKQRGRSQAGKVQRPGQQQRRRPGRESVMTPPPVFLNLRISGSRKLNDKVALITGGDSGIGRATAVAFAREGADVAIVYLDETEDAVKTQELIEEQGRRCVLLRGDLSRRAYCRSVVSQTIRKLGRLDILVNNAAEQHPQSRVADIDEKQLARTFRTNVYPLFFLTQAALPHLKKHTGSSIINTTSVTAYRGSPELLDYSSTKGAIVSFTRSLSQRLAEDGIRVNAVAPGPIWTPLIPSTFDRHHVKTFGSDTPLGRAGQPWECAECYVFLASESASYMTGQVLHPNGGEIING